MKPSLSILLTLSFLLTVVSAQEGLYAPAPPANSAFVRVINAPTATLGGKTISAEKGAASPYVVIPQGEFEAKLGSTSSKAKVEAGKFYTAFLSGSKVVLLSDQAAENRAKALLTVYNLTKTSIDLKTADGKTAVLTGVKPSKNDSRTVNGITVDLSAFAGSKVIGTVKKVKLERGNAYALVVTDGGMTITQSTTTTK